MGPQTLVADVGSQIFSCRIEPALDEIIDDRLDGRGVLRRADRMLVALRMTPIAATKIRSSSM